MARPRPEAALVRGVRLRLLLLSGGSTLVVLLVLGILLYTAVATSLAAAGVQQLRQRADALAIGSRTGAPALVGPVDVLTDVAGAPGLVIGGPTSGTIAYVVDPELAAVPANPGFLPAGLAAVLDVRTIERALSPPDDGALITETEIDGTPVRVLTRAIETPLGTAVAQVVGDRTAELRTLHVLVAVLLLGGLAALAAALAFGWVYADRALVPIRDAMRRQREFAADASHELRTPLAVVKASVAHLRRHPAESVASVGTALDDIDAEVDRLTSLVDDLLLLARADSGALEVDRRPLDLAVVVLDAGPALSRLAERHGRRLLVDAQPAPVTGDAARLRQLVAILVDNAVRHARPGGLVGLGVRNDGGWHVLRVDDDGPGIAPEHLPHVFDRFWRAPGEPDGGAGLGLAIAAWIADRHGGSITAATRPEGGARFEVRLPAS